MTTPNPFADPGDGVPQASATPVHQFPLPPETREYRPTYDRLRRYLLPAITGEGEQSYTRVTTGA